MARHLPRRLSENSILAIVLLVKIVGAVGFVALLAAGHDLPRHEYICRVAALLWFATFGVSYVLVSSRVKVRGRRWP